MKLLLQVLAVAAMISILGCGGGTGDSGTGTPPPGGGGPPISTDQCSDLALAIITELNVYRGENGLPPIPASQSLCTVAATHVNDLMLNSPAASPACNLHSWSDQGSWAACCYTPDHAQAECMWNKPRELTVYTGDGFENAAFGYNTAVEVMAGWRNSAAHNDVMLNRGIWSDRTWRAVGAAMVPGGYATLWFGSAVDPAD